MSGATAVGLRREWVGAVAAFAVGLAGAVVGVDALGVPSGRVGVALPVAVQWALPTAGAAAFVLWFCRRHLDANRPDGALPDGEGPGGETPDDPARRYGTLGLANRVTLARGGLVAAVAGFVAVEPTDAVRWAPAVCYGANCLLDLVDGALARHRDRTTVLGARLDMAFDTLGFLVAPVVAVAWGRLPVWYLSLSAARYLYKAGCAVRRRRGLPVGDLPPSRLRRPLAGMQMAFITVALAPVVPAATVAAVAVVVLAPSLAVFARDYLVVAGHLGSRPAPQQ
ncbi:CDP-alcohol phosphatidyltransferase [Halosimplex carlsbadense 2-9-1]|uniref:CDP-alcohol phosphatidyltransferase n=1 Tax=Halosimplex carlsbadense 2-9-1 TaxID=797114 RepID=M0CWK0_9EURY|nr:CDP-alcohol phosphatidyltransferase family protein [Halosimplex carlsbadense]ELZ26998.1 CDP-alcohol phosphatidyltransferase [Halosimplex carlsbadense 2-9-1]